jgi:hypothetical protein
MEGALWCSLVAREEIFTLLSFVLSFRINFLFISLLGWVFRRTGTKVFPL